MEHQDDWLILLLRKLALKIAAALMRKNTNYKLGCTNNYHFREMPIVIAVPFDVRTWMYQHMVLIQRHLVNSIFLITMCTPAAYALDFKFLLLRQSWTQRDIWSVLSDFNAIIVSTCDEAGPHGLGVHTSSGEVPGIKDPSTSPYM